MANDVVVLSFPAVTVESFEENYFCPKCQHKSVAQGKLVACERCGAKSLLKSDDRRYNVKATFLNNGGAEKLS